MRAVRVCALRNYHKFAWGAAHRTEVHPAPDRAAATLPFALLSHIENDGGALFRAVCEQDLEGIVAKLKNGTCSEPSSWIEVKNPHYSQAVGRHERFDRMKARTAANGSK